MKLQTGLFYRDGRVVSPIDLADLLAEFADLRCETSGESADGPVAMAYRGDRITWEEETETQPLNCGRYVLTFDGRLDNREQLASRLDLPHFRSMPDPILVAKTLEAFGDRTFGQLIGEFALALWCKETRSLLFARSVCGARSLYYVIENDSVKWSSDFAHLVRNSRVDLAINDRYVLEYLISQPSSHHTPLQYVNVVPPGTVVRFSKDRFQETTRYWDARNVQQILYSSNTEYEEHCREVMRDAVRVRLRAKHPVFAELSGGLDSSSVVMIADAILEPRKANKNELKTVSCVYEQSHTCDESLFIRIIEEERGTRSLLVHEADQQITLGLDDVEFSGLPSPFSCFPGRYRSIGDLRRQHSAMVLLTGNGGDHLFWSGLDGAPLVADEIHKGKLVHMHRNCAPWSRLMRTPYLPLLFGTALRLALSHLAPARFQSLPAKIPTWITAVHRTNVAFRFPTVVSRRKVPSRRAQIAIVENLLHQTSAGYFGEYRDIFISHPFTHRPLMEFCLAITVSQLLLNAQP